MAKRRPTKPSRLVKLDGILDDFVPRMEFQVSEEAYQHAVNRASLGNVQERSNFEWWLLHSYEEKLEAVRGSLAKRILKLADANMSGIQRQAFMLTYKYGVAKKRQARSMEVSRQSIQIRNQRALRRLKRLIYADVQCRQCMAEMMRLKTKVEELDVF